jgi:hypothetical protein
LDVDRRASYDRAIVRRLFATVLVLFACGCAQRHARFATADEPDPLHFTLFGPAAELAWPRQLPNDLLVHVVTAARKQSLVCAERADRFQHEADSANDTSRIFVFLSAAAGLASALLVGLSPVAYPNDVEARGKYAIIVGAGGTFVTGAFAATGAFTNADTRAKEAAKRLGEIQDAMKSFLVQWNSITRDPAFSPFKENECAGVELEGAGSDITNVRGLVSDETRDGVRWRMGTIPFEPYLKVKRCVLAADKARDLQARLMTETNQLAITCSKPAGSK